MTTWAPCGRSWVDIAWPSAVIAPVIGLPARVRGPPLPDRSSDIWAHHIQDQRNRATTCRASRGASGYLPACGVLSDLRRLRYSAPKVLLIRQMDHPIERRDGSADGSCRDLTAVHDCRREAHAGAMFPLLTAYYASLPVLIHPLFNLAPSLHTDEVIIVIAAAIAVGWNIVRIGILGRITEWAMGLELTVVTIVCLLTFILGVKHFGNLTQTAAVGPTSSGAATVQALSRMGNIFPLFVGAGVFNALWVLYTFENGGTLGEETVDAGRNAPRGVIGAYLFAVVAGFMLLLILTPSIPDMQAAMVGGIPAQNAITAHLPIGIFKLFLVCVSIGLIVATNVMFAGAVRHIYGMARDVQLPFSRTWSKTLKDGEPWAAVLLLGALSIVPVFVFTTKTSSILGGATAAMYVAYFLIMLVTLIYRFRGWPKVKGRFSLGRWGILVNIVAVLGTGLTALDLL